MWSPSRKSSEKGVRDVRTNSTGTPTPKFNSLADQVALVVRYGTEHERQPNPGVGNVVHRVA
jgi:hypothetical protein